MCNKCDPQLSVWKKFQFRRAIERKRKVSANKKIILSVNDTTAKREWCVCHLFNEDGQKKFHNNCVFRNLGKYLKLFY